MDAKVTVVTVCFNAESKIEKTIISILEQDYNKFEYVIKDAASTDRTNEIVGKYRALFRDKGVSLKHIITKDKGIYDAMNIAVNSCSGEWIIFMNAGDLFYNHTVLSNVFKDKVWTNSDVIYGHTLHRISKNRGYITNHDANFLDEGMTICHQSLFARKELLQKFPFDCKYKIKADYEQMLRIKRSGYHFTKINLIISDKDKEGISNRMTALCNKEDNILSIQHNLNWKRKSLLLGYIKQVLKKIAPELSMYWSVQKREKNIIKYK